MCLTIPGRILRIEESETAGRVAQIDFGVALRSANLLYTPEATVGSYVLVRAGFATTVLDEAEALEALDYARQLSEQLAATSESEAAQNSSDPART